MVVSTLNQIRGCIISYGTWYASGTCATFRAEKATGSSLELSRKCGLNLQKLIRISYADDTFTLKSSKGPCSVEGDVFSCGVHVDKPSEFSVRCAKPFLWTSCVRDDSFLYRSRMTSFATRATQLSTPIKPPRVMCRAQSMSRRRSIQSSWKFRGNHVTSSHSYRYLFSLLGGSLLIFRHVTTISLDTHQ